MRAAKLSAEPDNRELAEGIIEEAAFEERSRKGGQGEKTEREREDRESRQRER